MANAGISANKGVTALKTSSSNAGSEQDQSAFLFLFWERSNKYTPRSGRNQMEPRHATPVHCVNNYLLVPTHLNISAVGTEEIRPPSFLPCIAFYSWERANLLERNKHRHWTKIFNPFVFLSAFEKGRIIEERKSCRTCQAACRTTTPVCYFSFEVPALEIDPSSCIL